MNKWILLMMFFFVGNTILQAQKFKMDTLLYHGSTDKFINFVFLGDGYTSSQQKTYIEDVNKVIDYFFTQKPWSHYKRYFNAFAIQVISNESGAIHPRTASDCDASNVPVSNPDIYFKTSFDRYNIHRLVVPQRLPEVIQVLSSHMPNYDQAIIVVNSPYYGGSGGDFATLTTDKYSAEVATHEIGHSFARLSDEYWAGDSYAYEGFNMTKETNPKRVKWTNWIGTKDVGIYQHCCGGQSTQWYKPHLQCKMGQLNAPFCSVCAEAIVEKIHHLTNPIVSYQPENIKVSSSNRYLSFRLTELIRPEPNTLRVSWELDGVERMINMDSMVIDQDSLNPGIHTLTAKVVDTTEYVRIANHSQLHLNYVTWTIEKKKSTGIEISSTENKISYEIFPNPSSDLITISMTGDRPVRGLNIQIVSQDGKIIRSVYNNKSYNSRFKEIEDVSDLLPGKYIIQFKTNTTQHSILFQKI